MLSVEFIENQRKILDQTKLPFKERYLALNSAEEVSEAIKSMAVRGAPAIGIAAGYALALSDNPEKDYVTLLSSRPTAVDLKNALDFVAKGKTIEERKKLASLWQAGVSEACASIAENGASLLEKHNNVLTHCNTGAVATGVEYGTALGIIKKLKESGKDIFVYVGETRPRMQGAITSWELNKLKIPNSVIVDSAAGYFIYSGKVDAVMLGADRIAANGDFANKIGTYSLAVLAKENSIPFYVAAPLSSFDFSIDSGDKIKLEMRGEKEIIGDAYAGSTSALNPAFDITPARYVTRFITEKGIFSPEGVGSIGKIHRS